MAHWAVKHGLKVVIGVTVTALLGGIWWLVTTVLKVPNLEIKLDKHAEQLTTIRVNLLALMQRTGNPPDTQQLEKLVSGVYELGGAKAELIKQAQLEKGSGRIVIGKWATLGKQGLDTIEFTSGKPIEDKQKIGLIFYGAMISDVPASWKVKGNSLKLSYGMENVYDFAPRKDVSSEELELMATELNSLKFNLQELKNAMPTKNDTK
jgi:hypothetical protein